MGASNEEIEKNTDYSPYFLIGGLRKIRASKYLY